MSSNDTIIAIDQGTTSTRAILFDQARIPLATAQHELAQYYPHPGWVEHDAEEIWQATLAVMREVIGRAPGGIGSTRAIGITNQRETTVVWDAETGKPVHRAIVWQDRRTAEMCGTLRQAGHEALVQQRTGLLLDPYFSATKIAWILDNVPDARARADAGKLRAGTIDSFLIWRLTGGKRHLTDATNASRTALFDIHRQCWDEELMALFRVPPSLMAEVMDCTADFGHTAADLFGASLPITGVAGDQQAATVGQACFEPGAAKTTYGTGCFALLNTGDRAVRSQNRLLTTVAYRFDGVPTYAVEGSIFIAGAAIQWLRDGLGVIANARETEALANSANPESRVVMVPAFTGLGAPYWDSAARGALYGLTRDTGRAEIVRAALEAVCFQTRDLFEAMAADGVADGAPPPKTIRVDGGMVDNDWLMQYLADTLNIPVERPAVIETTALGAAYLAGLQIGLYPPPDEMAARWTREARFDPAMAAPARAKAYDAWKDAIRRTRH